ncbi:dNTP triphosphohydrolase, broad substrate specificity [hydrothermal vent metagenome]|uniref:DNTP triphosphohydrolase, broad substrate specificity n=1 Tax=hydrothermal vent metagenome TaxID=652676 RepID=A0A3B0YF43_9ZZZZ
MLPLAPYAALNETCLGRQYDETSPNNRSEFQRDRDRIIHSAAFRRLEYKTQVFVNHEGDLYRTRLTHSIEVAQVARSIARALQLNEDLTEAIALAHDLGHTPFGHAGQDALNACMHDYGGFEHNLQSLRVVDKLEKRYASFSGLNLTHESREGILKHCSNSNAKILGDIGKRFIKKTMPGLEAQLTNLADEIAYNSHDVDDGLRSGLITIKQLREVELFNTQYEKVIGLYPDINERLIIHEIVRRLIDCQVTDLIDTSKINLSKKPPTDIAAIRKMKKPLVLFSDKMRELNLDLKRFLRKNLYQHYRVIRMSTKAEKVIQDMFGAFFEHPQLLPDDVSGKAVQCMHDGDAIGCARSVADYIAGMTDRYAIDEHRRLFHPSEST